MYLCTGSEDSSSPTSSYNVLYAGTAESAREWQQQLRGLIAAAPDTETLRQALSVSLQGLGLKVVADADEIAATSSDAKEAITAEGAVVVDQGESKAVTAAGEDALADQEDDELLDKVQFALRIFFVSEGEPEAMIRVLRLGKRSTTGHVRLFTKGGTAVAGKDFEDQSSVITFLPGDEEKHIAIKLISDNLWGSTKEFRVYLSDAEGLEIDSALSKTRCKIVDDDAFPTNKYEKKLKMKPSGTKLPSPVGLSEGQASPWGVLREYIKVNFGNPQVRCGSVKLLMKGQILNGLGIATIFLFQFLTDNILLQEDADKDKFRVFLSLVVTALILLCFRGMTHFLDYRSAFWGVGGASRKFLMTNILRRWVAYEVETVEQLVPASSMIESVRNSAFELVDLGYMQIFPMVQDVSNLLFLCVFQALNVGAVAMLPMVMLPAVMAIYLRIRAAKITRTLKKAHHQDNDLVRHASGTANSVLLLRDYGKRSEVVDHFGAAVDNLNSALVDVKANKINDQALPRWLGDILVALYVICGGYYLVTQEPSLAWTMQAAELGGFQASLSVFKATAASLMSIYNALLKMQQSFASLEEIVVLLNLDIEDAHYLATTKEEQEETVKAWHLAMAGHFAIGIKDYLKAKHITRPFDQIPIEVRQAKLSLDPDAPVIDIKFYQGEMVAITGRQLKSGKSSLLKLLAGWVKPVQGKVFIPHHLEVVHVPAEHVFISRLSMLQNLCFGVPEEEHESSIGRCKALLARFGFDQTVIDQVASDGEWLHHFSPRQRALLAIVRAFMAEPDVLLIHYPLYFHEPNRRLQILAALREYVDQRGFMLPGNYLQRSPCTCVFTVIEPLPSEIPLIDRIVQLGN
eukprot:TRINITY_DN8793_c0_g1_i2.p1 TRINITY_DN8793_c0_g1~~TRINITY_DN8793_c0_g1_i2.p1  ORF type:complete len:867 (+),score=146.91 TRINITY_DN8793_c0_g1_i2:25-2601(+)